jgi:hypothetical protein
MQTPPEYGFSTVKAGSRNSPYLQNITQLFYAGVTVLFDMELWLIVVARHEVTKRSHNRLKNKQSDCLAAIGMTHIPGYSEFP